MQTSPAVYIKNASLTFDNVLLFDHLNLTLDACKFTCLLGPSGVGKTTLLRMLAGLIASSAKEQLHADISCDNQIPPDHQVAYHAQHDLLLPWLSARDNALLGARLRGTLCASTEEAVERLFKQTGLSGAEYKYPHQLSGGMRQRVALVRTLLENKPIVLMDEPFSALDTITRFQLQELAVDLLKNRTVLFVTHDPFEALRIADTIYVLSGKPATLQLACALSSPTPRQPSDPLLQKEHIHLFQLLTEAQGIAP
jgi:putative hydroxymethylpyrimidine transport system ATP-binding protein